MLWKIKEVGPALCKATFPRSCPLTPAMEAVSSVCQSRKSGQTRGTCGRLELMSPAAQTNEALGPPTRRVLNDMMYVRWSSHKTLKSSKRDPLNPDPHGAVRLLVV